MLEQRFLSTPVHPQKKATDKVEQKEGVLSSKLFLEWLLLSDWWLSIFLCDAETPVGCGAAYLVKGRIFAVIVIAHLKQIARG